MKYAGIVVGIIVVAFLGFATLKKVSPVSWGIWGNTNTTDGVALRGYDPVGYFFGGGPIPGNEEFALQAGGTVWHFSSVENKAEFMVNPERYTPRFGSFCAFAVSKGFTADADPEAWHIENDSLFVFADKNVRDEWVATLADGSLQLSEENWAKRQ